MRYFKNQQGFTIIELLLALALFSAVLMIVSVGFLNVFHMYETGLATRTTQDNGRTALEEISRIARSMATAELDTNVNGGVCFYQTTKSDNVAHKVTMSGNALLVVDYNPSDPSSYTSAPYTCNKVKINSPNAHTQLTASDVEAKSLSTSLTVPSAGSTKSFASFTISIVLVAKNGAPSNGVVFSGGRYTCAVPAQSYFCAVVPLTTTLTLRGTP